ncbi:AraC family transcriptional regulator [Alloacidobacterium dinghuense]|uniref:AraC family transcriptional regulator n=1 Tax=Alloacidobacterium dinghuense TaxID=2763107 RepID=A0A7G8BJ43_9BACT|nr:AraC family transcriptional regulator [Alloacidobacterium dinghuense]QNI32563.1 AraC family transcriptional regulator [Alloacidobacterium dinghuense]
MDRLTPFFERFSLTARVFYSGRLCGSTGNHDSEFAGHLHVLKKGKLKIIQPNARQIVIDIPSIVFFPRPHRHRLRGPEQDGAELVCATIEFGAGMLNPLIASFPEPLVLPLDALPELAPTLRLLFSEAFSESPGRQAAIDRLFEYVFVLLIRSAMNARLIDSGVLIGLSDSRLGRAIEAMHKHPGTSWSLEQLAQHAGMSRARFAAHFRRVVGVTPFDYLTNWRLAVAQTMLRKGNSLKLIAPAVGYANATALSRVFTQHLGLPPSEWLAHSQIQTTPTGS